MFDEDRDFGANGELNLERRLAGICGHLNVLHGQLLDLTVETLATDGWVGYGFRSPEHWIALHTGLSPSRAHQLVQLARRVDELPVTAQAVRDGSLSIDQAIVIAQTIPAHNDREACELAVLATVSQLRHALRRYQFDPPYPPSPPCPPSSDADPPLDPDGRPADLGPDESGAETASETALATASEQPSPVPPVPPPFDSRLAAGSLQFFFDEHGRFQLHLDAPVDDGLQIEAALTEARDALFRAGRTHVSWMEAFNEVCRRSIASNQITGIGTSRSDRYRIYVHLDTEGAWTNNMRLPQALLDQILCDGVVRPVWTTHGKPVNVGRATKMISPEMRRLILHRDGHRCRTPGCDSGLGLEIHHVQWFGRDLGRTDTSNLAVICGSCHHHIHRQHINLSGDADDPGGLAFTDHNGRPLIRHATPIPPTEPPPPPLAPFRHPLGERFDARWLWFKPAPQPPPTGTLAA